MFAFLSYLKLINIKALVISLQDSDSDEPQTLAMDLGSGETEQEKAKTTGKFNFKRYMLSM